MLFEADLLEEWEDHWVKEVHVIACTWQGVTGFLLRYRVSLIHALHFSLLVPTANVQLCQRV